MEESIEKENSGLRGDPVFIFLLPRREKDLRNRA